MLKIVVLLCVAVVAQVHGHGMMLEPVGRQSRWRYDSTAPANYNDNELFCGGVHITENGRCGLCGDSFSAGTPRPHELGGTYGSGVIVGRYQAGRTIPVQVKLTANHKGYFKFDICSIDANGRESEECFAQNSISFGGNGRYNVPSYDPQTFSLSVQIPSNLRCQHCVLRWTYVSGNNWGNCGDGTSAAGCGPQETFKNCADISIL